MPDGILQEEKITLTLCGPEGEIKEQFTFITTKESIP